MKNYFTAAILLVFLVIPASAHAGLAGDMIGMIHEYNSSDVPENKTVVSGVSDAYEYIFDDLDKAYTANPEDTSILVDFFNPYSPDEGIVYWPDGSFNGLVITDISAPLIGVLVETNFNRIAVEGPNDVYCVDKTWDPLTMMTFDASSVRFDWREFVFYDPAAETPYYFNASLTFGQETVVPEPASVLLFGIGGLAAALLRRKKI